jgi:hypothetical protein
VEGSGNRLMLSSNPLETIRSACPSHGRGRRFNPCSAHQPSLLRSYGWQTGRCARDSEEPRRHRAHDHATARVRKVPTITRDRRMQRLANSNPSYLQVISC